MAYQFFDQCNCWSRARRLRDADEAETRAEQRGVQSGEKSREREDHSREKSIAASAQTRRGETRRKGAEQQRRRGQNLHSFVARMRKRDTSRNAGGKRSYIGSARARGARGDRSHTHTNRHAQSSVRLTPLVGAAQARGCIRRARAQCR